MWPLIIHACNYNSCKSTYSIIQSQAMHVARYSETPNCSPEEVKNKLQGYQNYIREKYGQEYAADDQEICLLYIKSFEVSEYVR